MIIDLPRFIAAERPAWTELEQLLDRLDRDPGNSLTVEQAKHFHFLYQKVSADLARIATFSSEPGLRSYLESLVARAYGEIHETREHGRRFRFLTWFTRDFPRVFRNHWNAFLLSLAVTIAGASLGGFAVALDPEAKEAILPGMFANHLGDPRKRVEEEEKGRDRHAGAFHTTFAGALMVNNIKVSIFTLGLGMTFGVGTIIELFYNGVILGLVAVDYVMAGQTVFLLGWLMPHGVIEIPAILLAGQGGLILGKALIGWGDRNSLRLRLREIGPDLMTLIGGIAVMLVWAGIVESFLSQYHKPVLPYAIKIAFGTLELVGLVWFLGFCGRKERAA
ncbi:MAG TPA: stage II sporulation protein M [Chthoniobacteraceae bacterium]|nr:stage II sporulation protein M [Chthoniobacteraceae bacterium]